MFSLPTLTDLMERARQSFRSNLAGSDAWVWPNNIYASAKVIAGMTYEIFGFASYISRQKFAITAPDIESLRLHGEEFGIPQNPATPAIGQVAIASSGVLTVAAGALFRRTDGVEFVAASGGALLSAGTLTLPVSAIADGKASNTIAGTPLQIVSGVTGNATAGVSGGGIVLGADLEDIESYRARILFRKRNPPHGGSAADYVAWAGEVSGVSFYADRPAVYVNRTWAGPGTVRVLPLMFDLYENGIPQGQDIERVRQHIETLRPAGAIVTVSAPVAVPVDITISGLAPNTTAVREAVKAELRETFRRISRVAGTDIEIANMPYLATPFAFSRSWIWQAVANASGEDRHSLTSPSADIALTPGQIATLGTITFI